ncbi:unnamed protein product [Rotaria sp. Silwood2]|nr:unnamed protein product [Rotaria sp. Silwood2]CAF2995451.1 unnamed protein product [Rotaria sp. Silwood2]CAF3293607.1 unnamed protein product [Rotaria sp. Silwood2]CAF3351551.1 unnamed protein product [Rotaria sp. Silwood2]CAF4089603.1 unnamed protein product [Rotaria sp. Silwood2]
MNWRFNKESISILTSQSEDTTNYPYSTRAIIAKHDESNRIISAFRATEPIYLVQWLTDASTNFIDINNVFNDTNNNDNKVHFVLLAYGYELLICGVYTYGQPLVGNRRYAEILNNKLGNRIHRWVNHDDIVTRIPITELPLIAMYYDQTLYTDAMEAAANNNPSISDPFLKHYYHSGLRFKIDHKGNLTRHELIDQEPILVYQDRLRLFNVIYVIGNYIPSSLNIILIRTIGCFNFGC